MAGFAGGKRDDFFGALGTQFWMFMLGADEVGTCIDSTVAISMCGRKSFLVDWAFAVVVVTKGISNLSFLTSNLAAFLCHLMVH